MSLASNMPAPSVPAFWTRATSLSAELPAPQARRLAVGLLQLRRLWEMFDRRRKTIAAESHDPRSVYFSVSEIERSQLFERQELYRSQKVAWLPRAVRWPTLRAYAGQPNLGRLIDAGIQALEQENPLLTGAIPRIYGMAVRVGVLVELIALIERTLAGAPNPVELIEALLEGAPESASFPRNLGETYDDRMRTLRSLSSQAPYGKMLDRLDDQLRELDRLIDASRKPRQGSGS